ncbi:cell division topological specificity factor MinE [Garciella nitratireducens]|uniref:Cell division topological specificity factor n=1 Tax=Garciella nitratireducens DSM 15102 TaxID=1121911 RepID=A0A1T4K905_9FIRM|nr:cell division topological specificity factor MinE [Garciella nitratireducens]RBP46708.1 cell division topological specificity factor MinE [Garciella nitratireducens]SJZ38928.1 cell division topological specificity factor MinE [Garciella nitratireducens DSM 15102]
MFKLFSREGENKSKNVAKERLKLVLVHDRANVSPQFLEMIKGDIMNVIQDYIEVDEEGFEINLTKTKREQDNAMVPALIANIPIKKMKNRESIKGA